MITRAVPSCASDVLSFRECYREEMHCQLVHDSIHRRPGWTETYLLEVGGGAAGFGSVAIGGPWQDKPTLFEFYVASACRTRAFDLFENLLAISGAQFMEIQSNDSMLLVMLHAYAHAITSEKIVFRDSCATSFSGNGATLRRVTSEEETWSHLEARQGGAEWLLEMDGALAGQGGILFHYNRPYGDLYMEIAEPYRQRGLGSYLVQELKRIAYELGAVPCARCDPTNVASRRTLQKAGFVPFAHMLTGLLGTRPLAST